MNASQVRKTNKFNAEDAFVVDNVADFPKDSPVDLLTKEINVERQKILAFDAEQMSGFDDKAQAQAIYDERRDRLIDLLDEFVLGASIVEDEVEGTAAKFGNPYPRTDQKLIARATSYHDDSAAIETQLTDAGVRANGRALLITWRDEFQAAAASRDTATEHHAEATGGMLDSFRKAMVLSNRRDKRIRLKYRNNAAKLGAWTVASHLERAPHHAEDANKTADKPDSTEPDNK